MSKILLSGTNHMRLNNHVVCRVFTEWLRSQVVDFYKDADVKAHKVSGFVFNRRDKSITITIEGPPLPKNIEAPQVVEPGSNP